MSVNTKIVGTPLHLAILRDVGDVATLLVERGADPGAAGPYGSTPLQNDLILMLNCVSGPLDWWD